MGYYGFFILESIHTIYGFAQGFLFNNLIKVNQNENIDIDGS